MGNMSTLTVEVTIDRGDVLELGVRTDNNKEAMNRSYEDNWWDCTGRYKIDNFRLYCVSIDASGIEDIEHSPLTNDHAVYDLQGRKLNGQWSMVNGQWSIPNGQLSIPTKGIYIKNGKKFVK